MKYDVLSFRPWILSRKVADTYRAGRIFLYVAFLYNHLTHWTKYDTYNFLCSAGDAAHSFPPTGGLGLNSGLGDVHNLAYKLAAVHHSWAGDGVLDTYTSERRQVALVNSQQSVKNGKKIFSLLKTLGTTDPDVDVARRNLHANIHDPKIMIDIEEGIEGQREHFDNLGLHIGYVYGDKSIPDNASVFRPVCVPGARLPHAWIKLPSSISQSSESIVHGLPAIDSSYVDELSSELVAQKQFSTLDLIRFDSFVLIVDQKYAEGVHFAAQKALEQVPTAVASKFSLRTVVHGIDFVLEQEQETWADLLRLKEGGVVLVRPDQHILAIFEGELDSHDIVDALGQHLMW